MFEPFIWMFKNTDFKQHFVYLFFIYIKFFVLALICYLIGFVFFHNPILIPVFAILAILFFVAPGFCIQGYFWELTENIISRDWDIKAANVYNGKIKEIYRISLPELNTVRFIWRGFASVVATILMVVPFGLLITSGTFLSTVCAMSIPAALLLYIFLCTFIPALLWNYAAKDSVFAVWNIRKAVYIMGNYTGKYIWNTILFIIFYLFDYVLLAFITYLLKLNNIDLSLLSWVKAFILLLLGYAQYIYCVYVYAYLLGTITPPHEN